MTHGLEKSDSAVVAVKPANKAAPAVAEWVEPRAGTKGNASECRLFTHLWRHTLNRRSQKEKVNLQRMDQIADAWLPTPRILHPWPSERFAVKHPRQEPDA